MAIVRIVGRRPKPLALPVTNQTFDMENPSF